MEEAPRRAHDALAQVKLLSLVFFCCPGLFNALSSIASGLQDPTIAFCGNVLIYSLFAVSSVAAAALLPTIGVRRSLVAGAAGYVVYALSLWNLSARRSQALAGSCASLLLFYVASALLGVSAGLLWTAQGQMIMSYSTAQNQGEYLSLFWVIFNLGATGGGLLTCVLNWNALETSTGDQGNVSNTTFAASSLLMAVGVVVAATCIAPLDTVVKQNGERVVQSPRTNGAVATPEVSSSWRRDAVALARYASSSRDIALLLPFFVYSNWFYTYHAFFNVATFNARTSGLASACYWTAQMLAAAWLGEWLDGSASAPSSSLKPPKIIAVPSRIRSARAVLIGLAIFWNGMWAVGWVAQSSLSLAYDNPRALDIVEDPTSAVGPLVLYTIYGAGDALGQVWVYWYLSSVCPSGRELRTAGFNAGIYKSVQALSAALSWYIGSCSVAPTAQLWINWALSNAAIASAAWSVHGNTSGQTRRLLGNGQD